MIKAAYFSTNGIICTLNVPPYKKTFLNCHKYRVFRKFKLPFRHRPVVFPETLITFERLWYRKH